MGVKTLSYRDYLGPRFSEGARRLWLALAKLDESPADCARRVSAKGGVIPRVLYGDRTPNLALGVLFEEIYGVKARLWGEAPRHPFTLPAVAARNARALEAKRGTGTEG